MSNFLEEALRYASLGWKIFPLAAGKKTPCTAHGVKDATTDEKQIRAWWERWPNANIAVACGKESGIYVVDVDVDAEKGIDGRKSLAEFPPLPDTILQNTPRGGFHAFFKTGNAPANRNSFRPGIDIRGDGYYVVLAPSIHPNGGSYSWGIDHDPFQRDLAEYPDFMRPATRAPWAASVKGVVTLKGVPIVHEPFLNGGIIKDITDSIFDTDCSNKSIGIPYWVTSDKDTLRRASMYLATIDPAIQGQGGHDKLLWAAVAMVHGFQLSDSQAYDLLAREYNPVCIPPWDLSDKKDEKDFRRKITEARKLTPQNPPGWLLDDPTYAPAQQVQVDIKGLIDKRGKSLDNSHSPLSIAAVEEDAALANSKITEEIQRDAGELQFLVQPTGLLGEICSWINATSMCEQPMFALACALPFLGTLFGRKIRDTLGSRTNLYCMTVGNSSAGKAHGPNQIRRLAEHAGCIGMIGGDWITGDAAIESRVADVPSTLFLWDEIGHLLSHIKSGVSKHHAQVVSLLMKLYSAAGTIYLGREYADTGKQRIISEPCLSIYGTSTMERFAEGISVRELHDGWLSRCLVFQSNETPRKIRKKYSEEVPGDIAKKAAAWYARGGVINDGHTVSSLVTNNYDKAPPGKIIVQTDHDADNLFVTLDDESRGESETSCLWAKSEENARRIALIIAAGENFDKPVITASIADYACRLVRFLLRGFCESIVPEIVSTRIEQNKRDLLAVVKKYGKQGCPKRDITRKTQWTDQSGRNKMLADLIEAGEIAFHVEGKTLRYWTPKFFPALKNNKSHE